MVSIAYNKSHEQLSNIDMKSLPDGRQCMMYFYVREGRPKVSFGT